MSATLTLPGVPAEIGGALGALRDELARAAGANLVSLVLYGGLARGRFRPGKSDVNVAIVLKQAGGAELAAIAGPLRNASRAIGVEPLVLALDEIPAAAAAFPTKFLDIQRHHIVLAGDDPLQKLTISREQVRARAEQELCNLLLRLRHDLLRYMADRMSLARTLTRLARPLALELAALLYAADKRVPDDDRSASLFEAAAAAFELPREPLATLAGLRHDAPPPADLATLGNQALAAVARALEAARQLGERRS